MSARHWVYSFEEGNGSDKMLLGGKGANLCEMTHIGLNVPPGFVITTAGSEKEPPGRRISFETAKRRTRPARRV